MQLHLKAVVLLPMIACHDPSGSEPGIAADVTYHEHAAPLLARACTSCHTEGGIAPFVLNSFESAKTYADAVKSATGTRRMPPIAVDTSGDCNQYSDPRILSDEEIATLAKWVDQGAQKGDPAKEPKQGAEPPKLARVDATLDPGEAYAPKTTTDDDYRCFVIDPGLGSDKFLTAYEVRPDQRAQVHHVVLYSNDTAAHDAAAEALDADDPGLGYTCFGGSGTGGGRSLAVWAPGTGATFYPKDTGLRVYAGRKVVMQVHYNRPTTPDRTTIALTLEDKVPKEALITAAADLSLNLNPSQADVTESNTTVIPPSLVPYRVWGVYPHMHRLGRSMRLTMNLGLGEQCVADVPRYDFGYQQFFFYDEPIVVPAGPGGTFTISCSYDTRGATQATHWGEGTNDEMCIAGLYVTL